MSTKACTEERRTKRQRIHEIQYQYNTIPVEASMDVPPMFNSVEDECRYWKERAKLYHKEWTDVKQEYDEYVEQSRQKEAEMDATLDQKQSIIKDLRMKLTYSEKENESVKIRPVEVNTPAYAPRTNRPSCRLCRSEYGRQRKTRAYCFNCDNAVCGEHSTVLYRCHTCEQATKQQQQQ